MTDNIELNAGSGGAIISADDIGGVWTQIIKLAFGALNTATLVTASDPLPVTAISSALPSGAATSAKQDSQTTLLGTIDADTGSILTAVELIDDAIYIDDADWTDNTSKHVLVGGVYQSAPHTVTDGDVTPFLTDVNGRLAVAGTLAVTQSGTWDEVGINDSGNSITVDWAGTAPPIGAGTEAAALRVTIATDSTGVLSIDDNGGIITVDGTVAVTNAGTFAVQDATAQASLSVMDDWDNAASDGASVSGDVAHDSSDAGEPVKIGTKAYSPDGTTPGTAVAENDRTNLKSDLDGMLFVAKSHPVNFSYHDDDAAAVTTDGTLKADPGDGFTVCITDLIFSIGAATASSIFVEEGASKILGPYYLEAIAGRGLSIHFNEPKRCTASTAILVTNTGSIVFGIDALGFVEAV